MDRSHFETSSMGTGSLAWPRTAREGRAVVSDGFRAPVPFVASPPVSGLSEAEIEGLFPKETNTASAAASSDVFPQSIASGDPRPQGIVLWTRLAPEVAMASANGLLAWQIASRPEFADEDVLLEGVAEPRQASDFTVKLAIEHPLLQPYTVYFYRFLCHGVASRTGRFKTLPAPEATVSALRLGYVVCQDYGNGFYTALHHLAMEEVDYVLHLGDYIYETIAAPSFQRNPVRIVPPFASGGSIPANVDDYRHLYRVYKSDPNQQAVHERFAYVQLWDDHEFANDCHGDSHPDSNTAPDTAATPQPALRQAANQAWSEYGLLEAPFDPQKGWEHSIQLYRTIRFGALAEMLVTDERLYRDGPPCGSKENFERYYSLGCEAMHDRSRSMLGATQREWFLERLQTMDTTWKLWANEVMLMQLKVGPVYISLDQWDGYQEERNTILNAVKHGNIENFVALTGDLHTFIAGYLKTDFSNPFESHVGVELMVGSLTSTNFAEEIEAALPSLSRPAPAKHTGVAPALLAPVVRAANPWIRFWDSATHGYGVLTITSEQLRCEFKAVTTITEPTADLVPLAIFTVPAGRVELIQD